MNYHKIATALIWNPYKILIVRPHFMCQFANCCQCLKLSFESMCKSFSRSYTKRSEITSMWNTYAMKIDWHAITQNSLHCTEREKKEREKLRIAYMHNKINISFSSIFRKCTANADRGGVKWLDVWKIHDVKKYMRCVYTQIISCVRLLLSTRRRLNDRRVEFEWWRKKV